MNTFVRITKNNRILYCISLDWPKSWKKLKLPQKIWKLLHFCQRLSTTLIKVFVRNIQKTGKSNKNRKIIRVNSGENRKFAKNKLKITQIYMKNHKYFWINYRFMITNVMILKQFSFFCLYYIVFFKFLSRQNSLF